MGRNRGCCPYRDVVHMAECSTTRPAANPPRASFRCDTPPTTIPSPEQATCIPLFELSTSRHPAALPPSATTDRTQHEPASVDFDLSGSRVSPMGCRSCDNPHTPRNLHTPTPAHSPDHKCGCWTACEPSLARSRGRSCLVLQQRTPGGTLTRNPVRQAPQYDQGHCLIGVSNNTQIA